MNNQFLIWIPAYNEEKHVAQVVCQLKNLSCDIVVSDAGSKDNTAAIAKSLGVKVVERSGFGKGFSVQDALIYCEQNQYEYLILIDCDDTYLASDVPKLMLEAKNGDLILGNRNLSSISLLRRLANFMMTKLFNIVFQTKLSDVASGLRILKVSAFSGLVHSKSFDVETELCAIAARKRYRIVEVPIAYIMRLKGSKAKPSDLIHILWKTFYYRFTK